MFGRSSCPPQRVTVQSASATCLPSLSHHQVPPFATTSDFRNLSCLQERSLKICCSPSNTSLLHHQIIPFSMRRQTTSASKCCSQLHGLQPQNISSALRKHCKASRISPGHIAALQSKQRCVLRTKGLCGCVSWQKTISLDLGTSCAGS